jgi:hypothetical protein
LRQNYKQIPKYGNNYGIFFFNLTLIYNRFILFLHHCCQILDYALQRLSFAGLVATDSAKASCGVAKFGYKFEMLEKEESRKS